MADTELKKRKKIVLGANQSKVSMHPDLNPKKTNRGIKQEVLLTKIKGIVLEGKKVLQPFTVRNQSGQYMGTYKAFSEQQAIQRHQDGQNTHNSTFRSHAPSKQKFTYTAKVEEVVNETKADKVGQAYNKRDYDLAYSAPYTVLNDPSGPSSLKDLAFRVIMVRSEFYDENEDAILAEARGQKKKKVSEMNPQEVGEYRKMQQDGKDWVSSRTPSHHNIIEHYNAATADEKAYGHSWYQDAHHLSKHVANDTKTPMHTVAGLVGNYSPQTDWASNIMTAAKVARTKTPVGGPGSGVFASLQQKGAAGRMLSGEHHTGVLKGHKIRAFTHLIEHGGNADPNNPHVVIDRHAAAVAHGGRITDAAYKFGLGGLKSKPLYNSYEQHYHNAAQEINRQSNKGPGWKPVEAHQVQAVTWLVRQRRNQQEEEGISKTGKSKTAKRAEKHEKEWAADRRQYHPNMDDSISKKMVGYNAAGTKED